MKRPLLTTSCALSAPRTSPSRTLKAAERDAGVQGLPVLALVSGPACRFAGGMLGDRAVEHLALPARLPALLRAARRLAGDAGAAGAGEAKSAE